MDDYGVSRFLELDDHESLLLAAWVRSCYWLHPAVDCQLETCVLPAPAEGDEEGRLTLGLRLLNGKVGESTGNNT
jgi:hypothetical protein